MITELSPPLHCEKPYTVSEINEGIESRIESGNTVVWFTGEISNFKRHSSGHCYLRLKDQMSQIPAVIWRSRAGGIQFRPEDGMAVNGIASIRVYKRGGYYQLDIQKIQPAGQGALFAEFEALKKRLASEGLFDPQRKKELPSHIQKLAVITSKTGAALRDILRVTATRAPGTEILLVNVHVQGDLAAPEICRALRWVNEYGSAEAVIVGRGGGSIEDLWAFNEESVARAIAESSIPVISAVGHETDFTIADFTADIRAATPSAAAEIATSDIGDDIRYFETLVNRFFTGQLQYFTDQKKRLRSLLAPRLFKRPIEMVYDAHQAIDTANESLKQYVATVLREKTFRLKNAADKLEALSPLAVLSRGYSVVKNSRGDCIKESYDLKTGDSLSIRFHKGSAEASVKAVHQ